MHRHLRKHFEEWDRALIYVLLMMFGLYSTIYPIVSFEKAAPHWAEITLGAEFVAAGILLLAGMAGKRRYRYAGLIVVAIGLFTISGIIAAVGGSKVLSYAFLFGAFGMQSVYDLRRERIRASREKDHQNNEEIRRELVELARATRPGSPA
jgi:hypothetical protein